MVLSSKAVAVNLGFNARQAHRPFSHWCRNMEMDADALLASLATQSTLVMMHRIKYPANCGAVLRQLPILGAEGLLLCHGGEKYSQKWIKDALRVSMAYTRAGSRPPLVANINIDEAIDRLVAMDFDIYPLENIEACYAAGVPAFSIWETAFSARVCFILGSEDYGIPSSVLHKSKKGVYIPSCTLHTGGSVDSLNISVAAAIALAERRRQLMLSGQVSHSDWGGHGRLALK